MKSFPIDLQWRNSCLEDRAFTFDRIFFRFAGNQDTHKISDKFEFCPWVQKKHHIWLCPEHSLFSFSQIFMRLADNLYMHKILNKFEFRPNQTIDFGVTCPLVPKNTIFNLVCLVLIKTWWILQIIWTGIKSRTSSNSFQMWLMTFELLAL